jgi:hypothetical protein
MTSEAMIEASMDANEERGAMFFIGLLIFFLWRNHCDKKL